MNTAIMINQEDETSAEAPSSWVYPADVIEDCNGGSERAFPLRVSLLGRVKKIIERARFGDVDGDAESYPLGYESAKVFTGQHQDRDL